MDIDQLAKMSEVDIASWIRSNTDKFSLISDSELESTIDDRDHWEERATELANDVGTLLNVDVGEHSSANCPVQNAINSVYQAAQKKAKTDESQLLLNLKAEFIESDVSQLKDAPIGESIASNASFKIMLKNDSES